MSKQSFDEELVKLIRDYYTYMKLCEQAGNSTISHTTVATAIQNANKLQENIVQQIKQAMREHMPEKKPTNLKSNSFTHIDPESRKYLEREGVVYNKAIDDVEKGFGL